ncbi:MAG: hypothetical protein V4671_19545 [Armatimonadota bacterium]
MTYKEGDRVLLQVTRIRGSDSYESDILGIVKSVDGRAVQVYWETGETKEHGASTLRRFVPDVKKAPD